MSSQSKHVLLLLNIESTLFNQYYIQFSWFSIPCGSYLQHILYNYTNTRRSLLFPTSIIDVFQFSKKPSSVSVVYVCEYKYWHSIPKCNTIDTEDDFLENRKAWVGANVQNFINFKVCLYYTLCNFCYVLQKPFYRLLVSDPSRTLETY